MFVGSTGQASSAAFYSLRALPAQQAAALAALKKEIGELKPLSIKDYTTAAGQAPNPSLTVSAKATIATE